MNKAVLTIDDGPSEITSEIIEFLQSENIPAIMFFLGKNILANYNIAKKAIKAGFIIGNHSVNHFTFSKLSIDECKYEIEETERLINELYLSCGITKYTKLFRFPNGDKGKENKNIIQDILHKKGYVNLELDNITNAEYESYRNNFDKDIFWTLNFKDYLLSRKEANFNISDINVIIENELTLTNQKNIDHVFLMHDHPQNNEIYNQYYKSYINKTLEMGIQYIMPKNILTTSSN